MAGFEGLAADLHDRHAIDVPIAVTGTPWQCAQEVEEQLLRIGQEALNNAVRHGRATRIDVALDYGQDALTVRVTDDGARIRRSRRAAVGRPLGPAEHA